MAWAGSHTHGFPSGIRRTILTRSPTCQCSACHHHPGQCTAPSTEADHITPRARGGTNHPNNGQALCHPCHQAKTQTEATAGRAARPPTTSRRPPEPHPGLVPPRGTTPSPHPQRPV
jgi:5-methylcytosine-specific restriction endonuclease McrA